MTETAVAPPRALPAQLSHRQILVILSGLMLGMFLAALDQTIVGTSIRTIADDLDGLSLQAWATTAYLITSTITTPIYGKLSDIYGRKPFYLLAISLFVVGSLACTFSQSMYQLAAFRALQGLGAGGLMSLAFTIIADIVSPRERAKYQGYFMAVFGTSSVLGPVLGGFLAGQQDIVGIDGWRWVFLVNVPIGIVALFVVARVLNVPHERHDHKIDWLGALTLVVGVVPLLIIAEQGREWGWASERAILCYVVGAIGLVAFVLVEAKMKDAALIPLRLFRNSTFSSVILAGVILGVGMFGGITMVPQYLQIVKGETPTSAGLLMLPLMVGIMIASFTSGRITSKTGRYKIFPIIGSALLVVGMGLFYTIEVDSPLWQPMLYMGVFGLGLGLSMQTLTIAAQNAAPPRDMGVATASATFFRQMGGTLGVAVFLSLLFSTVGDKIREAFERIAPTSAFQQALNDPAVLANPQNAQVIKGLQGGGVGNVLQDSSFLQQIDPRLARPFLEGFTDSIQMVFLAGMFVMVLAFIVSLFIKEIPLRSGNAIQSAMVEGGEALLPSEPEPEPEPEQQPRGKHVRTEAETVPLSLNGHQPLMGAVQNGDGSAVGGAILTLIDHTGQQVARGNTDAFGRYQLQAPGSGAYVLIASAPGHQPSASSLRLDSQPLVLDLTLIGAGEVVGVVRTARVGNPVQAATVTLTDREGHVIGSHRSASDGTYRFTSVGAGAYTLVVNADGYSPAAVPLAVPEVGEVRQDVQLTSGAALCGVARNHRGVPVAEARITIIDKDGSVVSVSTTGDDGRYRITELGAGEYTVIASGYAPTVDHLRLGDGEHMNHDVTLGFEEWK
ncbi:MFS transporter [Kibdelosporangium phytohabitans]|uniref:MFS transporter n=1 Tax=Kibdelosporangium phytohabitans TaxID=860235 RepID=A0A0N9HUI5_9PSEU|nr:DHA2 family efflux MFS transporter permease subunit [Kibdelosporangium phytohabitans]ALG06582.1 MFS transporter [Kibdelosporangium phytohabitans]MBE1467773.1 EmrB/QacA subfamily drug resistance transporter [Kibdelosporangium phytohabitans]